MLNILVGFVIFNCYLNCGVFPGHSPLFTILEAHVFDGNMLFQVTSVGVGCVAQLTSEKKYIFLNIGESGSQSTKLLFYGIWKVFVIHPIMKNTSCRRLLIVEFDSSPYHLANNWTTSHNK